MLAPQIKLDIDTGAGNIVTAGNAGALLSSFNPLFDIAFAGATIDEFDGVQAGDILPQLDVAIASVRLTRGNYFALPESQFVLRPQFEAYLVNWRDLCRKHPNCVVSIVP